MPDFLKNITPTELQLVHYGLLILISLGGIVVAVLGWLFGRQWLKQKAMAVVKAPLTAKNLLSQMVNFPQTFDAYVDIQQKRFDRIEYQLNPNGSKSLRDAVDRIEDNQNFISNKLRFVDDRTPQALFEIQVRTMEGNRYFECVYVNPALCRMLGYPPSHLLGMNIVSKIEETERETFLGLWNIALKTATPLESRHHILHGETRQLLHVKFIAQPQRDAHGHLSHYFGHLEHASRLNA
ncbi:MAG TPA: PAS domain-containing protein [Pyrinomonadaceae bacterium]|jgi:PAS domain S-box-containing protein